jgi:hypothetical protein
MWRFSCFGLFLLSILQLECTKEKLPAEALPWELNAGGDQVVFLPTATARMAATIVNSKNDLATFQWLQISGPAAATFENPQQANTAIGNLREGIYELELTARLEALIKKDTIRIRVIQPVYEQGSVTLKGLPWNCHWGCNIDVGDITMFLPADRGLLHVEYRERDDELWLQIPPFPVNFYMRYSLQQTFLTLTNRRDNKEGMTGQIRLLY